MELIDHRVNVSNDTHPDQDLKLEVERISLIRHVRHLSLESWEYKKWEVDVLDPNQPAPVPASLQASP